LIVLRKHEFVFIAYIFNLSTSLSTQLYLKSLPYCFYIWLFLFQEKPE